MIIYNASLNGSIDGVRAYIGTWDLSVLKDGSAWSDAAAQIFFSLSVAQGIATAYGSFAPAVANLYADNLIIIGLDTMTSVMAGFAVFSILGNMAERETEAAAASPALRISTCERQLKLPEAGRCDIDMDCNLCQGSNWAEYGACCGSMSVDTVAQTTLELAFSV